MESQVIVEEEALGVVNRDGYVIPKVRTIDDPDDVVVAYQRHYETPKDLLPKIKKLLTKN